MSMRINQTMSNYRSDIFCDIKHLKISMQSQKIRGTVKICQLDKKEQ